MQIRRKLNLLLVGVLGAVFVGIGIFIFIYYPSVRMNIEKSSLFYLDSAISEMRADVNKLGAAPFDTQVNTIKEKDTDLREQYSAIDGFEHLKKDPQIREVLGIIVRLFSLYETNYDKLVNYTDELAPHMEAAFYSKKLKLDDIRNSDMLINYEQRAIVKKYIDALYSTISILDSNLISTHSVVQEQFEVIDSIIERRQARSYLIGIIVIMGISIVVFYSGVLYTFQISKNIKLAVEGISRMSSGDLSSSFNIKSNDEIGALGKDLNILTDNLKHVFQSMKAGSNRGVELKIELITSAEQTSAAAAQIAANAQAIAQQFTQLNERVEGATGATGSLRDSLSSLEGYVQEQTAMVEESTSAVTEMISSINNVSDITEKKRAATDVLVKTAESGGAKLGATIKVINEINASLDQIKGAATIIQQIASQTNLLAMNAAIEAAHAGDAGRGFAVVADEIRKLAEASSTNSKQINGVIKDVVNRIEVASAAGHETEMAFTDIDREVEGVAQSFDEISASMSELNIGGKQILEAMTGLQDVSVNVNQGSRDMTDASDKVTNAIEIVSRITSEVSNSAQEITLGITEVSDAMMQVTELSGSLGDITDTLEMESGRFKTGDEEAAREPGTEQQVPVYNSEPEAEETVASDEMTVTAGDVSEVTISDDNSDLDIESFEEV